MAVRSFATNNLVEDHDNYVKFMKTRWSYLSKEDKNTDILFYKKGLITEAFDIKYNKENRNDTINQISKHMHTIKLWHSITIAYNLWCDCSRLHIDKDHGNIIYKQFVDISEDVLKKFKFRFEQTVKNARCEYKTNGTNHLIDPCRLLAMFWTYLDITKNTGIQRYFPNNATIERAAKVFGYKKGDNPFKMNGVFMSRCTRNKKEEEKPMTKEVTNYITNDRRLVDIIDDKRLTNPLWRAGIKTVGEFRSKSDKELLKIRTFGAVKLRKVKEVLDSLAPEESVIDIAKQAAKEVDEEKASPKAVIDEAILKEYERKIDKATLIIDDLRSTLSERNKHITTLENDIAELEKRETKLNLAANPKNLDTFTLLNIILEKMKDSKMEYILLTIDGITVDIHPAKSFPIRASYQIRSSEV